MHIRWTAPAADDLERIACHIRQDNPEAALKVVRTLCNGIFDLKTLPNRGRIGRQTGTRELVFFPLPYIAVYRVKEESVEILHIYHGAQLR